MNWSAHTLNGYGTNNEGRVADALLRRAPQLRTGRARFLAPAHAGLEGWCRTQLCVLDRSGWGCGSNVLPGMGSFLSAGRVVGARHASVRFRRVLRGGTCGAA